MRAGAPNQPRFERNILSAIVIVGVIALGAIALAAVTFRTAALRGEETTSKRAEDLVLCHELAQLLERKLAKSRSFIVTGEEAYAQEMEDARSDFQRVIGELRGGAATEPSRALFARVGALEARHHAVLREQMRRRRRGATPGELAPALLESLKPVRDELDETIGTLIGLKRAQLRESEQAAESGLRFAQNVSAAAGTFSLLAFLVVLWLVRRLAAAQREVEQALRTSNADLDALVADRTRELSAFNRELESFSYSVAHDLRTPLRAITNYGELASARADRSGDAALKGEVDRIRSAGLRMGHLIDALLALSRLTRKPMTSADVDLSALVSEVGAEIASADPGRRVRLRVHPGVVVAGDPDLLRVAVYNLLDNAWKFTRNEPDAEVEFGRAEVDGAPCVFVRDNGAGFDERFTGKLFTPFERLHSAKDYPGTGIGLATVERVVHRHGGSVWAEGRLGEGATFYFTLNRRVTRKERVPARGAGDV